MTPRRPLRAAALTFLAALLGCQPGASTESATGSPAMTPAENPPDAAAWTGDGRLEIRADIDPQVTMDRIPMRSIRLHFRNATDAPLRLYLPPDPFRFNISSVVFAPEGAPPLLVPEPRPHGYMITEKDFLLLAPREERVVTQSFSIDPMVPGPGTRTARRPGFEEGRRVPVRWTYENRITSWPGGVATFDGVTKPLFGGGPVPHLWTGEIRAQFTWTVPD